MSSRRKILIVEDDEDLRTLFRVTLTLAGYDVQEAGDGLEALRQIDHSPPDLVVLELMLPFVVELPFGRKSPPTSSPKTSPSSSSPAPIKISVSSASPACCASR